MDLDHRIFVVQVLDHQGDKSASVKQLKVSLQLVASGKIEPVTAVESARFVKRTVLKRAILSQADKAISWSSSILVEILWPSIFGGSIKGACAFKSRGDRNKPATSLSDLLFVVQVQHTEVC